ncbi:MAG: hypothetical protein PHU71_06120 [Candidatus Gracilibacteria bacterium]|nr:hypothetical protein [Candidatus Gracilibacteria bacterium]
MSISSLTSSLLSNPTETREVSLGNLDSSPEEVSTLLNKIGISWTSQDKEGKINFTASALQIANIIEAFRGREVSVLIENEALTKEDFEPKKVSLENISDSIKDIHQELVDLGIRLYSLDHASGNIRFEAGPIKLLRIIKAFRDRELSVLIEGELIK